MMLLTQKLGTKLQRSKSYYAVGVVSGSHWPPFCKRRGQPLQVCAHVYQSRAKRALVCLSPGYQSLSPKTSICSIFLQNPSFIFFLPGLPTYQHVHAHVFACNRRYCSPLSFTSRKKISRQSVSAPCINSCCLSVTYISYKKYPESIPTPLPNFLLICQPTISVKHDRNGCGAYGCSNRNTFCAMNTLNPLVFFKTTTNLQLDWNFCIFFLHFNTIINNNNLFISMNLQTNTYAQ